MLMGLLLLTVAVVISFGPDAYVPMLIRSWLPLWLMISVSWLLWIAIKKNWAATLFGGLAVLLLSFQIPRTATDSSEALQDQALRIAHLNVLQTNQRKEDVVLAIRSLEADVICVQEVDQAWSEALQRELSPIYPYHRIAARDNCYGIAIFSRRQFAAIKVFDMHRSPAIDAVFEIDDRQLRLIAAHAASPQDPGAFERRNAQLDALASIVIGSNGPCVVIGDLNATPWDPALQRACARSNMKSTATITSATWPSIFGMAFIPLDHLLVPSSVHVRNQATFHVPGSDHRGMVADIMLGPG